MPTCVPGRKRFEPSTLMASGADRSPTVRDPKKRFTIDECRSLSALGYSKRYCLPRVEIRTRLVGLPLEVAPASAISSTPPHY